MRILILSASVGAGHIRAAEAVEAAIGGRAETMNIDVLTEMAPAFRSVYGNGYLEMVTHAPRVLGWLYEATDKPFHKDAVRQNLERAGAQKLLKKIRAFDPDVAVCTHFLPPALLDRERRKGRLRARIMTVVTDFEVHGMWLNVPSDHYFVATDEARAHLQALGIEPSLIASNSFATMRPALPAPNPPADSRIAGTSGRNPCFNRIAA